MGVPVVQDAREPDRLAGAAMQGWEAAQGHFRSSWGARGLH